MTLVRAETLQRIPESAKPSMNSRARSTPQPCAGSTRKWMSNAATRREVARAFLRSKGLIRPE